MAAFDSAVVTGGGTTGFFRRIRVFFAVVVAGIFELGCGGSAVTVGGVGVGCEATGGIVGWFSVGAVLLAGSGGFFFLQPTPAARTSTTQHSTRFRPNRIICFLHQPADTRSDNYEEVVPLRCDVSG